LKAKYRPIFSTLSFSPLIPKALSRNELNELSVSPFPRQTYVFGTDDRQQLLVHLPATIQQTGSTFFLDFGDIAAFHEHQICRKCRLRGELKLFHYVLNIPLVLCLTSIVTAG
jgi:hypothetical protein